MKSSTNSESGKEVIEKIDALIELCKKEIRDRRKKVGNSGKAKNDAARDADCNPDALGELKIGERFGFNYCVEKCVNEKSVESYKAARKRILKGKGTDGDFEKMEDLYSAMQEKFGKADSLFMVNPLPENSTVLHGNLRALMRKASRLFDKEILKEKKG